MSCNLKFSLVGYVDQYTLEQKLNVPQKVFCHLWPKEVNDAIGSRASTTRKRCSSFEGVLDVSSTCAPGENFQSLVIVKFVRIASIIVTESVVAKVMQSNLTEVTLG